MIFNDYLHNFIIHNYITFSDFKHELWLSDTVKSILSTNSFVQNGLFGIMDTLRLSEKVQKAGLKMMEILSKLRMRL